jgi:hypothetical protein
MRTRNILAGAPLGTVTVFLTAPNAFADQARGTLVRQGADAG